jgi:hypothetical protein
MRAYMRSYRERLRQRDAELELELARPRADDPAALAAFRAQLRSTDDPEVADLLRRRIVHLEKLYGQRPGKIAAGDGAPIQRSTTTPRATLRIVPKVEPTDVLKPTGRVKGSWLDARLPPPLDS